MSDNPFTPHSPAAPQAFVDREREVDLIFDHLRSVQRGNVAISGTLGMGKTSLLRYIAAPEVAERFGLQAPETLMVYLDTQSVAPFSADRFWRRVAGLAARRPGAALDEPTERLLAREQLDVIDIEEFLDSLADRGIGLILLLDEFEWALQTSSREAADESRHLLAQLASLARRSPRVLGLIVATERPLPEATRVIEAWRGSPFATVFTSLILRPLDRASSDRLIRRALSEGPIQFDEREMARLHSLSEGRPSALQAAAFSLFHGRLRQLPVDQVWSTVREAARSALEGPAQPPVPTADPAPLPAPGADGGAINGVAGPAAEQGLWLDPVSGEVSVNGERVASLTALEYSLLQLLYSRPGQLCSKADIIRQVWGEEFMGEVDDSRVEKLISRLRRKIEPMPGRPQHVRTVRGRGYRYVP